MIPPEFEARPGRRLRPVWKRFVLWLRSRELIAGPGIRLAYTPSGVRVSASVGQEIFRGAFPVMLAGDRVTVGFGLCDALEPRISGTLVTGEKGAPPTLRLNASKYDAAGRSWIGLRLEGDPATGKLDPESKTALTVVQSADPRPGWESVPGVTFHPLAVLRRKTPEETGFGTRYQIAYFHLRSTYDAARQRHYVFAAA